jgi:hypothetical protein
MDEFAERLLIELPTFRLSRANSSRAAGQVAAIISALVPGEVAVSHLNTLLKASADSETASAQGLESLAAYRATVVNMPTLTEKLDKAKKNFINALDAYEIEQTTSLRLLRQVNSSIREMLRLASASGAASTSPPALPN